MEDWELKTRAARIEQLVQQAQTLENEDARSLVVELLQALMQLYGEGLGRAIGLIAARDPALLGRLVEDELVSHLLMLHDLHPVSMEERIARALEEVRPSLQAHGGDVSLVGVMEGVARVKLQGNCHGCASSMLTLKGTVEEAVRKAAPEVTTIEVDEPTHSSAAAVIMVPGIERCRSERP